MTTPTSDKGAATTTCQIGGETNAPEQQVRFRSVLPHEPLPTESKGYLIIQGAFEPRIDREKNETSNGQASSGEFWTKSALERALLEALQSNATNSADAVESVEMLDHAHPFTKARLTLHKPQEARNMLSAYRSAKVTPAQLLGDNNNNNKNDIHHFSTRPLQVTQVTTQPVLLSPETSWPRSNPPKFRRLLARPGEDLAALEQERDCTRFVFITGLVDDEHTTTIPSCWNNVFVAVDAIRNVMNDYDSSCVGVEVFVSNKRAIRACHVGMRSPADAKRLISSLQGQQVEWKCLDDSNDMTTTVLRSGRLFLDYADITKRSYSRGQNPDAAAKGEPSRSECTSLTSHVVVPGLVLVPDFCSEKEEEALVAVLTGPQAPWAPPQSTPSLSGNVKRRVQHYGYVFDYETADVLRDRSKENADCPPMPALPEELENVDEYIEASANDGRGWQALAGMIERTRRHDFSPTPVDDASSPISFPDLNQMTVNEYKEGSGIGSHVDTKTAFGDGLISISLNSGIVMEFRQTDDDEEREKSNDSSPPLRKLVYLPRRSMLLMSGPARYSWEHMIVSRMTDTVDGKVIPRGQRVSLTLRTALELPSDGGMPLLRIESNVFPPTWGNAIEGQTPTGSNTRQTALATPPTEKDHVHAVYDAIATQWHHTRGKRGVLWPGATQFLQQLPRGSVVADVGCGDGKYFAAIWEAGSFVIGTDISLPLLKTSIGANSSDNAPESRRISQERNHLRDRPAVAVADCMNVPLRRNSCDAAICIAVMHHISTEARRLRCIEELVRVVRPGGLINIQAWAMEQDEGSRRKFAAADVFVPFNAQPKYLDKAEASRDKGEPMDSGKSVAQMYSESYDGAEFDERKGLVVFKRYCHLYRSGELEELASRVQDVELCESGYESGNYFVILRVVA